MKMSVLAYVAERLFRLVTMEGKLSMERKNVKRFLLNGQRAAVRNGFSPFPKRGDEEEIRREGNLEREKKFLVFSFVTIKNHVILFVSLAKLAFSF